LPSYPIPLFASDIRDFVKQLQSIVKNIKTHQNKAKFEKRSLTFSVYTVDFDDF